MSGAQGHGGGKMKITIKDLAGSSWELEVRPSYTVLRVKHMLCDRLENPIEQMILFYGGESLTDHNRLDYYNISDLATVDMYHPWPVRKKRNSMDDSRQLASLESTKISRMAPRKLESVQSTEISELAPTQSTEMPKVSSTQSTEMSKVAPVYFTALSVDDTASQSHEYWETKAREGDFDEDLHIVDPQSHFHLLKKLKRDVIHAFRYILLRLRVGPINVSTLRDVAFMAQLGMRPETQEIITRAIPALEVGFSNPPLVVHDNMGKSTLIVSHGDVMNCRWPPHILGISGKVAERISIGFCRHRTLSGDILAILHILHLDAQRIPKPRKIDAVTLLSRFDQLSLRY